MLAGFFRKLCIAQETDIFKKRKPNEKKVFFGGREKKKPKKSFGRSRVKLAYGRSKMGSTAQYGCTVANRFAFSVDVESDEEDPFESLKKLEIKKKEEKEKSTQKAKELKDAKNNAVKKVRTLCRIAYCHQSPASFSFIPPVYCG